MTAKAMTPSQQQRFIRICEDQGIGVSRTKKGLFLRFPDGSSTVQHFTTSDVKATQNQIARFRRAGMTHPEDPRGPKDLPKYITEGTITPATRKKIIDYVVSRGIPDIVYQKDVTKDLNMDPGWANRALYHTGFRPGKPKSAKIGRPWYTPQDIVDLREQTADEPVVGEPTVEHVVEAIDSGVAEDLPVANEVQPPIGEPDPVVVEALEQIEDDEHTIDEAMNPTRDEAEVARLKSQESTVEKIIDREFIDSHESWVVDPQELFGGNFERFLRDELRVIKALGLEFEIRVWRKDS